MFNDTKYTRWYDSIISAAQLTQRSKGTGEYFESHHIIPKSLGGSNKKNNLVLLTAREHYICHLLLPKMCIHSQHKAKMVYAFMILSEAASRQRREFMFTGRLYERFKLKYIASISGSNCYMFGVNKTPEQRAKISQTRVTNQTSAGENNPMFGKTHSDESKQQMSITKKQKIQENPEAHKFKAIAANPKTKRVITDTGEIFPSLSEAGRAHGYAGAQGVRSRIAKGLWKYLD